MLHHLAFAAAALAVSSPLTSAAPGGAPVDQSIWWPHIQHVEPVAPQIWVMRQPPNTFAGVVGNVVIVRQSDGIVLVDAGGSNGVGTRIVAQVKAISPLPVKAVILTHWHNDHPLGLSAIRAEWPNVRIISTRRTWEEMDKGSLGKIPRAPSAEYDATRAGLLKDSADTYDKRAADQALDPRVRREWSLAAKAARLRMADGAGTYLVMPNVTFTDRYRIDDRIAPIEIAYLGWANTDGDAIVWLPRQRVLATGDAVVSPIPYLFSIKPSEMRQVLEKLDRYKFRRLIPGHGEVQANHDYLKRLMTLTDDVQAQVTPLAKTVPLDQIRDRTDFNAQRKAFAGDDPWLARWFDAYALNPLIASVYREARNEPPPD